MFTARELASALNKKSEYAHLVAFRLKKRGVIKEIEKGKYSTVDDAFLAASWITWPSYITGLAAVNYYKLSDQLPFVIHVVTTRRRKNKIVDYASARIEFIKVREKAFFGFKRVQYGKSEVFIAEKEKAIVDGVAFGKMSLEEAVEIVRNNARKISKKRLFAYARISRGLRKKLEEKLKHD